MTCASPRPAMHRPYACAGASAAAAEKSGAADCRRRAGDRRPLARRSDKGLKSLASAATAASIPCGVQPEPASARSACRGAAGDAGQAAIGETDALHAVAVDAHAKGRADGGNILVDALRELVARQQPSGGGPRNRHPRDELARRPIRLAVGEVEILERHAPQLRAAAQFDLRSQRDQRRDRIADRRAVREIAAQGGGIADRRGCEARRLFFELGIRAEQRRPGVREGDRGADPQFVRALLDTPELRHVAEIDQGGSSRSCFVTSRPMSVPPASSTESGRTSSASASSSTLRGA